MRRGKGKGGSKGSREGGAMNGKRRRERMGGEGKGTAGISGQGALEAKPVDLLLLLLLLLHLRRSLAVSSWDAWLSATTATATATAGLRAFRSSREWSSPCEGWFLNY